LASPARTVAFHELKCVGGEFMVAIVFVGF
jgi:hypothetical protein